ncbi:hypothetical protein HT576_08680 [Haloterrigena sp. SYSU A121-1]|uniref:Uncharacterized protein n=1 Tax=Haloterrigena gelatinilytica TaxID=2741724 RepID=A0A8J8KHF4_9EURY|nr:hypothetical protein [Haloterrigena gelatinilytica]NUB91094.1 hypothetical protein [Haloterrigena gelatinilytica]
MVLLKHPWYLGGGIGLVVLAVLTRQWIPIHLWLLVAAIGIGGFLLRLAGEESQTVSMQRSSSTIRDNLESVQQFLKERDGHYRFDLWNHADSVNEDTLYKNLGGEKQTFYAVIGDRYDPTDDYPRTQLFVWNRTKNEKHAYYRDVRNENLKHDPLYRHYKRRFLKAEGRSNPERANNQWVGTNINVEQSSPDEQRGD